jgi:hypothetical protein
MSFEVENEVVKIFVNGKQIATRKLIGKYGCYMINFCGKQYALFHEKENKGALIEIEWR